MKIINFGLDELDVTGEVRTKEVTANGERTGIVIYLYDSSYRVSVVNSAGRALRTEYDTADEFWADLRRVYKMKKRKRIFMWSFLAIQAIFVTWIVAGAAMAHNAPSAAEVHRGCDNGGWQALYSSHADCMTHYASLLHSAGDAGTALGVGLVIFLWVAADIILGVSRLIVLTARKHSSPSIAEQPQAINPDNYIA